MTSAEQFTKSRSPGTEYRSFLELLRARSAVVILILSLAFALRLAFIFVGPVTESRDGDPRYYITASNLLAGRGYSRDEKAPYLPHIASVPLYTFFIAAVYATAGERTNAVRVAQAALDVLTCMLVAFLSFCLAPARLKQLAALAALIIYGLISWFTIIWTTCIYAETLTIFLTTLTLTLCALALDKGNKSLWAAAGLSCGLAILTRPDSVLLMAAVLVFLMGRAVARRSREVLAALVLFLLTTVITLVPWTARNYVVFGVFEPLASEYGCPRGCDFPTGYLHWVRTWLKDMTHFDYAFNPPWFPETTFFDPTQLPPDAYDNEEERLRVAALADRFNRAGRLTPEIDADFRALANERIRRAPLRFFIWIPLYRSASMWLTGFSTRHPTPYVLILRVFSVLPIHLGAILAFTIWTRRRPLAMLLILVVVVRTLYLAFHYAPETRYIVEAYPPVIAACGVAGAALWSYWRGAGNRLRESQP